jgi:hypothetical protein
MAFHDVAGAYGRGAMHADNDNNRTIWTGAFVWRRHWPLVLAALL